MELSKEEIEWRNKTVAFKVDGRDYTVAEAHQLFDSVQPVGKHWKDPFYGVTPNHSWKAVREAICFFHGVYPVETYRAMNLVTFCAVGYAG